MATFSAAFLPKVGIVGAGLIGRSWAMLFAAAGYRVSLYDSLEGAAEKALELILKQLTSLKEQDLLRGKCQHAEEQHALISAAHSLEDCVTNSVYVQECVPEDLELKRTVWRLIDYFVDDESVVLASSTSCIPSSKFSEDLKHRAQVLVAHPINPPYFVPLVEIVPASWTSPAIVEKARKMQTELGQSPVTLKKEVAGFALNRLQYPVLNECWNMVEQGLLSVEDVDRVVKDGLGPRYAFMGPFETIHLNAEGIRNYCERYGETIWDVSQTLGFVPKISASSSVCDKLEEDIQRKIPIDSLAERRQWRDEKLASLAKLRRSDKESL
ncbi:hypothetical protein RvY_09334 [Ramazzottius varieornatus]|uniref:L-gulonate 3-dehydrogenase n=1 Tax=Ramazzottius varieornatus TaxID=947166 RepID=A0A1D1V929_RAMVA|nr:hypothetical protein RvY_09334 [Ramazzottius varieornatus]